MYVATIATLGLLGLRLLVLVVVGAIRASPVSTPEQVAIVTLLAFGLFYQWPGVTWLAIGVAAAGRASTVQNARIGNRLAEAARSDSPGWVTHPRIQVSISAEGDR